LRFITIYFLVIFVAKFSFCPTYPRMVAHLSYDGQHDKTKILDSLRTIIENDGFAIKEYIREDGFLSTDYKTYDWGTGRRLLAVAIHINDKITITGMGKMDIPVSSIGSSSDILKLKTVDRLPYSIQKKTFLLLIDSFRNAGYNDINHWP